MRKKTDRQTDRQRKRHDTDTYRQLIDKWIDR